MMGYRAASKKAIKDAIAGKPDSDARLLNFESLVQETSFFGAESKVPGRNLVVGPDAYTSRKWYGTLTVDADGRVTKVE